jgi:hypothetical protein
LLILTQQRDIFIGALPELKKLLLADCRYPHEREHRVRTLFEVLGSACIIARNQLVDPIKNRLGTAKATQGRSALTPKINDIIAAAVKAERRDHPKLSAVGIAKKIRAPVNEQIAAAAAKAADVNKKPLGVRAILLRFPKKI